MRSYDEAIDVQPGRVGQHEGPAQFLWRNRLWKICDIQSTWLETAPWWNGVDVRAARGETPAEGNGDLPAEGNGDLPAEGNGDLLAETELWRVVAAQGRHGSLGVYELSHNWSDGQWRLRTVLD